MSKYRLPVRAAALAAGLILAGAGCGPSAQPAQPVQPAPAAQQPAAPVVEAEPIPTGPTVDFTGSAFSPSTITVSVGEAVVFTNSAKQDVWPASDPHPSHTGLPGFDAQQALHTGDSYRYVFTKAGTFGFHSHLNPSVKGTVIVK